MVIWIRLTDFACVPPYVPGYDEVGNYSELLARHSEAISDIQDPLVKFAVSLIIGTILLLKTTRQWRFALLFLLLGACAIVAQFMTVSFCDKTALQHIETVEFDGKTYHLTYGDDVAGGWDVFSKLLILHECEHGIEDCRGQTVTQDYSGLLKPQDADLIIDEDTHQLKVLSMGQVVFVLDASISQSD